MERFASRSVSTNQLPRGPRNSRLPYAWMPSLSGARVVVTGGAGTVGSHIVDAVIEAGAREVLALDALVRGVPENLAGALGSGRARLVEVDIRDREAVRANLAGADIVFHQAGLRW